ncbi:discoidin domain-containing protein [Georgenia deserti]|uniref:galactosylceramidase n=1 Tax=Georgenia deserti TaxID=2093781 RepID=A0ABW4L437_9MICO
MRHWGARTALFLIAALVGPVAVAGPADGAAGPAGGAAGPAAGGAATETVHIDGADAGREFDGLGAVSAGASSRLLFDYPEPERSQILDYLFKPGYGAELEMLKVEIGADTNSTSGAEPSHMREPDEVDCGRGYEWWLMREARERNPDITLGGLQWGAPHWLDGGFWSQDNIDYLLSWLDCAEQHGIAIDFMGGWNEAGYDRDWYVAWADALEEHHPEVELTAADDTPNFGWRVADDMAADQAFGDAVDIANMHSPCGWRTDYSECSSTETARSLDKPLWIGEQSALAHDAGAGPLARAANRMFIDAQITGMMVWSPISAWYANITMADTGLMVAEWPWSGFYDVGRSIWSFAHTNQFAEPGWRYLDTGSRRLDSGATQVALVSPDGGDWSTVIETLDMSEPTTVTLELANLPGKPLSLWGTDLRSDDESDWFRRLGTVRPDAQKITLHLEPGRLYSLTTADGPGKGEAAPRASVHDRLDVPFHEDFDAVEPGRAAPFFSDLAGAFEAAPCAGGRDGTCYRQVVTGQPISWGHVGELPLSTMIGDPRWWGDYAVRSDVLLEEPGHVEIGGRVSGQSWGTPASGYHARVGTDGWQLISRDHALSEEVVLAQGSEAVEVGSWHELTLSMRDQRVRVLLDGEVLAEVRDTRHRTGNAALGVSAWHNAQFDDVRVVPTGPQPQMLPRSSASATSEQGVLQGWTHEAAHAVDDRPETSWSSSLDPSNDLPQAVTVDLGEVERVQALTYQPQLDGGTGGMITDYEVQVSADGQAFETVADGRWRTSTSTKVAAWPATDARFVRLIAQAGEHQCGVRSARAAEIGVVSARGPGLTTTPDGPEQPPVPDDAPAALEHLVPQDEMTASASSEHSDPNIACMAIDGRRSTFWHSAPAATDPLPASVTLDLGRQRDVRGLAYLPRQDGNPNGVITRYEVAISDDGEQFDVVADGTWEDDAAHKYATWETADARYVRLTAVEGHFDVAAAAELQVGYARSPHDG